MSDSIDEYLKDCFLRVLFAPVSTEADAVFMARNFREGLRIAGYEIVPSDRALLARGEENVAGAKTHD